MQIRLQKWLSEAGIASRRKAEEMILAGRVSLNGQVVTELGIKANTITDVVTVDNKRAEIVEKKVYIMLNKPEGYVTTVTDTHGRQTVMELVPSDTRLFPVGRLDTDTSGLLLFTNDGAWADKLTHPRFETKKTYSALVKAVPTPQELESFRQGLEIEPGEKKTLPAEIKIEDRVPIPGTKFQNAKLRITIREGRNRQVRKMCEVIGHRVLELRRIEFAGLKLGALKKGEWRHLTGKEMKSFGKR